MGWTCLACRLGCCSPVGSAQHRPRREPRPAPGRSPPGCRPPRHAPQAGLRPHLVAKSCRTLTKKSGTAEAIPDFFGRGRRTWSRLPPRSVRGRAPLALAHPSARGFGVDVETAHRERGRGCVTQFFQPARKTAVLVWCFAILPFQNTH